MHGGGGSMFVGIGSGAAQEVAQNVFTALARKAWRFAPDDSLPAWLHKAALLESQSWLRAELGRRRREQTAAELGTGRTARSLPNTYSVCATGFRVLGQVEDV